METGLTNKVAVISGASKGIGKAIAYSLADEGVKLSICSRNEEYLSQVTGDIQKTKNVEVIYSVADMINENDISAFVRNTIQRFGKIDILINNAGSAPAGDFLKIEDDVWLQSWKLKFFGYMRLAREVFPYMMSQRAGRIINIIGAWGRYPMKNYMVGGHINAALLNLTKLLSDEGAKYNILVNGINPGPIKTDRWDEMVAKMAKLINETPGHCESKLIASIPLNRPGLPEEVADLVTFLASERATYINGTIITIDGGMTKCI